MTAAARPAPAGRSRAPQSKARAAVSGRLACPTQRLRECRSGRGAAARARRRHAAARRREAPRRRGMALESRRGGCSSLGRSDARQGATQQGARAVPCARRRQPAAPGRQPWSADRVDDAAECSGVFRRRARPRCGPSLGSSLGTRSPEATTASTTGLSALSRCLRADAATSARSASPVSASRPATPASASRPPLAPRIPACSPSPAVTSARASVTTTPPPRARDGSTASASSELVVSSLAGRIDEALRAAPPPAAPPQRAGVVLDLAPPAAATSAAATTPPITPRLLAQQGARLGCSLSTLTTSDRERGSSSLHAGNVVAQASFAFQNLAYQLDSVGSEPDGTRIPLRQMLAAPPTSTPSLARGTCEPGVHPSGLPSARALSGRGSPSSWTVHEKIAQHEALARRAATYACNSGLAGAP